MEVNRSLYFIVPVIGLTITLPIIIWQVMVARRSIIQRVFPGLNKAYIVVLILLTTFVLYEAGEIVIAGLALTHSPTLWYILLIAETIVCLRTANKKFKDWSVN